MTKYNGFLRVSIPGKHGRKSFSGEVTMVLLTHRYFEMIQVEIQTKVDAITVAAPLGTKYIQPHSYPQLYVSESGQLLPDNIYYLRQNDRVEMCDVTKGRVRGAEWIDPQQPFYLMQ